MKLASLSHDMDEESSNAVWLRQVLGLDFADSISLDWGKTASLSGDGDDKNNFGASAISPILQACNKIWHGIVFFLFLTEEGGQGS